MFMCEFVYVSVVHVEAKRWSSGTGSHEAGFPPSCEPNPPHCGFWEPPQHDQCTALLTAEPPHQSSR